VEEFNMENRPRYHSLFWPFILVGVGIVWLLSNLQIIPTVNLGMVFRFWPLLLVFLGLDILFGRRYPWAEALVGVLAIGGVVALLVASPALGIDTGPQTKTETFSAPLGQTTMASYTFETSSAPVEINTSTGSADLISAEITHRGTMKFDVTGTTTKSVKLSEISNPDNWFSWDLSPNKFKWDIQLAPHMATDLVLDGGSGSINMDLTDIMLKSLRAHLGSGSARITMPITVTPYTAEVESGSGSVNLEIPATTDVKLVIDSGSGSINVSVPSDSALRVEIMDTGSGSVNLRSGLEKISTGLELGVSAWRSPGYDKATHKVLIQIQNQGSGSITID
jgi:hypothetical protein